ncbi:lantibiotic dehydratase [Hymenobacter algoricola]|uniref:Lantibiotic dehydratase n=1 Tax=Hymenobacter algoricola TaxID=486267 RepID=A0ABP7NSG8_9BACT
MNTPYVFDKRLVVRTPRFAFSDQLGTVALAALLQDEAFLEAIYLASPVLYKECIKCRDGQLTTPKEVEKLGRSVSKYFRRMSSRCTPFGLFSGCGLTQWHAAAGDEGSAAPGPLVLDSRRTSRHTRLDMHFLCALAQQLATLPVVRQGLRYVPNTSLYRIGEELRYVEYLYHNGRRKHQISSVAASPYLSDLLTTAAGGATIDQLAQQLISDDITAADAHEFLGAVVGSQLLVNELEPAITGPEFLYQLLAVLEELNQANTPELSAIIGTLRTADRLLAQLDANPQPDVARYQELLTVLDSLGVPYDESKLFQTDLVKAVQGPGLASTFQEQLQGALTALNKLTVPKSSEKLQSFKTRFTARYEDREMPLLEVMDTETGLGYLESSGSTLSPLVGNLHPTGKEREQKFAWGKLEAFLNRKLQKAYADKTLNVELTAAELSDFTEDWQDLPPSLSILFRVVDASTVYIESVGGSSAANLLGRFAHADAGILDLVGDIARTEQAQDPDVVYAEIIHLPESRVGNILLHPVFRAYEIPYLAKSSLAPEFQLDVHDLFLSVQGGRLVLRSKRLNKEIIPRLSTAHNYSNNALPVYQFLCDLQLQDKRSGLYFNWGNLQAQHQFLPRVTFQNAILHLARWSFAQSDVKPLLGLRGEARAAALTQFRAQWQLPRHLVLADGDNELLVDLDSESMVDIWLEAVKNRPSFLLREFITPQAPVVDEHGAPFANQLVAVLLKQGPSYRARPMAPVAAVRPAAAPVTASFAPGSEWVYYKVYCGLKAADKILLEAVKPLTEELRALGLVDKWFFIRYNDPDFHLRLRLHLPDVARLGDVLRLVHSYLQPFQAAGYLWQQQLDTYQRELDRYGHATIEQAETFFYHDSEALLALLDHTGGDERETVKWSWGLRAVDELLDTFRYTLPQKADLLLQLRTAFGAEFGLDKPLKLQLDYKYRSNKAQLELVLDRDRDLLHDMAPLLAVLRHKSAQLQPLADDLLARHVRQELRPGLNSLLSSYIHMLLNRITTVSPRLHELVLYDFLSRYYQSALARAKPRAVLA